MRLEYYDVGLMARDSGSGVDVYLVSDTVVGQRQIVHRSTVDYNKESAAGRHI